MTIVIPMAGLSSRFTKAGYTLPKYMLYVVNKSLFNIAVSSFKDYFDTCDFLFIARDVFDTRRFIEEECSLMKIANYKIIMLDHPTKGQAETVMIGLERAHLSDDEAILIFNIDTFRPGYIFPTDSENWDGYLEVFKGHGSNWSYAKTENGDNSQVIETVEKKEISDNCSTGIYYFRQVRSYRYAYNKALLDTSLKELYVAPLYNALIAKGQNIRINVIRREDVIFCGVPQEYCEYLTKAINGTISKPCL